MHDLPDYMMEWDGTKAERISTIDEVLDAMHCDHFPTLNRRNFNRLFLEAFVRSVVQAELIQMMQHIINEENKTL